MGDEEEIELANMGATDVEVEGEQAVNTGNGGGDDDDDNGDGDEGLDEDIELARGARTPATPSSKVPFFPYKLMSAKKKMQYVKGQYVYPYSAAKCFQVMKNYAHFLKYHLLGNERDTWKAEGKFTFRASPAWIKRGRDGKKGTPGAQCEYAYDMDGVVYWMVDEITTLDNGSQTDVNGNPIYCFAMATQHKLSKPSMPMHGHGTRMIFTTFENDPNKCHLEWIRFYQKPVVAGCVSLATMFHQQFEGYMRQDLFALWQYYHASYSTRLPKRNDKVVIIGAGPSGLHMAYMLINRGLNPANITILEKDKRYGGKTLSVLDDTNVQIHDPVFNPPPNCIEKKCEPNIKDIDPNNLAIRKKLPNALQVQQDYFKGGQPVYHELGTCYLSPAYYAIRTLLKEIQHKVVEKSKDKNLPEEDREKWLQTAVDDITREVAPDTYAIESKDWHGAWSLPHWVFENGKDQTCLSSFCCLCPETGVDLAVFQAYMKYVDLHQELMGWYYYTLPPRPMPKKFKELNLGFEDFLTKHKLQVLIPLFTYALTAQGYGTVKLTPTFLAMQWLNVDILDGYFAWYEYFSLFKNSVGQVVKPIPKRFKKFDNPRKGMLVSGWGSLWDRIVSLYDLGHPGEEKRIEYNCDILSIKRQQVGEDKTKVTVVYLKDKKVQKTGIFDFLIVAAPMQDAHVDPTTPLLPLDFTEDEADVFLNKDLAAGQFGTTLFKPEKNGPYEADHLRIFIDEIQGDNSGKGGIFGVRDSYKAIQPRLSTPAGDLYDPARSMPREKMCYQYISPGEHFSPDDLKDRYVEFMLQNTQYVNEGTTREQLAKMTRQQQYWTYYTHYEREGLTSGKLWKILDLQGRNKTLFVHASTNFESVLDIVNYNNMLLDGLDGALDDFIRPVADTRPAPWQRPQEYLINTFALHVKFRQFLNVFITIFWTLWYMISWPFAEGIYLRFQRKALQKDFETPDLGSGWSYNMSKFINVSPVTRGFLAVRNGIPNGIPVPVPEDYDPKKWDKKDGPGDTVFKILMAPKTGFTDHYPDIPNVNTTPGLACTMQWNVTDFRLGIQWWLTTFKDTFDPILSTSAQKFIRGFSYLFPNMYSWVFSWIFASQFRLLIGYSRRFEDEEGGGLWIPDCNMLRTAVKDHGVEAGQRICLTVCKVFTEEVMKKKRMEIDFEPDFILGKGGYGCKVRMRAPLENAFSNHSLFEFRTKKEEEAARKVDLKW